MHKLFAFIFLAPLALAQQPGQTPAATQSLHLGPGTVFPVTLAKTLDAKKLKAGDPVEAKVTEDLKATDGAVIIPKDTQVLGHVTEAQPRTKEQKESQLGLLFDHLRLKNGTDISLPVSIQALVAAVSLNADNSPAGGYAPPPSPGTAGMPPGMGGVQPGMPPSTMGTGMPPQSTTPPVSQGPSGSPTARGSRPAVNENTQGVVGIPHLKLSPASTPAQASLVTSEKGNVKLDSGTLVLLRVNP